jgi:hypothetical protein
MDNDRLSALERRMSNVESDIKSIKDSMTTIEDLSDTINKLVRWVKTSLPLIATACVTSGIVSGKWGAFIQALFH